MVTIPTDERRYKKAVAYVRISSTKQIDNESPDTQREKIQQYADNNNIEIIKGGWFFDEAKSGKNAERDDLKNLLKFALNHRDKIDHVIVYKMNRASRDLDSYIMQIRGVLKARGITIRSATEQFDDSSMGKFMEIFHIMVAQMDNENKREYTLDNMRSLAEQGYYQHPPIVGYDSCKIPNHSGKLRPSLNPNSTAPKVQQVLERFSVGDISKAELARYAERIGLRSRYGKVIGEDSLNRMLKHPVYAGYICDKFTNYELYEAKHEAIISKETFDRNQSFLYAHNKSRKNEIHLKKNEKYVLKGILLCSGCNKRLYASAPRTGSGGHSPRYHCGKGCKLPSILAETVHSDFEKMLKNIKPNEGVLKLYKEILRREANNHLGRINGDVQRLRDELGDISSLRLQAIQKFTTGDLTMEEKNELADSLEKRRLETDIKLKDLERQQSFREADIDHAINFMERVDKQWSGVDFDLKQRFQKMMFPKGLVYDSSAQRFGTSEISVLYRLETLKRASEEAQKSYLVAGAGLEPATLWL